MWAVSSGEVRGEVGTRSGMCYVGWVVWVHGVNLYIYIYIYIYSLPPNKVVFHIFMSNFFTSRILM